MIDSLLLGHWIEMRSVRQASGALNELAKLLPDTATRIAPDGSAEDVSVNALHNGDLILVRPGSSVPADGLIEEGISDVNQTMITGESQPVAKEPGDTVVAGTINGMRSLRVRVTTTGDETALAGIMRLVTEAQQSKSHTQILADRAADWWFYLALGFAALTAVGWTVAVGLNPDVLKVKIFTLSHTTYRKMIENLVWATGYNILALPLAAGVLVQWGILLSPAVGVLLMSLSTVIVAINAQLLCNVELQGAQ